MSGHSYVAMEPRVPEDDAPRFSNGRLRSIQIPKASKYRCDHTATICPTQACIEGWETDHIVHLDRTVAGRQLKELLVEVRALLYRPSWQSLRVSFLKENRTDGGWTTMEGTRANIDTLNRYVLGYDPYNTLETEAVAMSYQGIHEMDVRLYRAINCLNAVRMGNSGAGTAGSDQDYYVLDFRDELQKRQTVSYHQRLTYAATRWDWRVVKKELATMIDGCPNDFKNVRKNLQIRAKGKTLTNRPELVTFLQIMEEVRIGD